MDAPHLQVDATPVRPQTQVNSATPPTPRRREQPPPAEGTGAEEHLSIRLFPVEPAQDQFGSSQPCRRSTPHTVSCLTVSVARG